ncbi:MAG: GPR endopeptidase, partial [Oscillospiraceae bacterium]|nr:GPR endopeptidase [Oscillospiraceae bacterium]
VLVTRHLRQRAPEQFADFFPVAALSAGVLGSTGVESGELVAAVAEKIRPDLILAVDALAARGLERLCTTVQIADTGITPGSGVGNARRALDQSTLGVPVIALGVPTVVDGATLAREFGGQADGLEHVLVTPKDVDALVEELAKVAGYGINAALQRGMEVSEMDYFLS